MEAAVTIYLLASLMSYAIHTELATLAKERKLGALNFLSNHSLGATFLMSLSWGLVAIAYIISHLSGNRIFKQ